MSLCGKYVNTFAEASHALPEGMHMNADYPFMLPPIVSFTKSEVTLRGRVKTATVKIKREGCREFCEMEQCSTFEILYRRKPQRFRFYPFKDERTPAIGGAGLFDGRSA